MNGMTEAEVKNFLRSCDPETLNGIAAYSRALQSSKPSKGNVSVSRKGMNAAAVSRHEKIFYQIMAKDLEDKIACTLPEYKIFMRTSPNVKQFRLAQEEINAFVVEVLGERPSNRYRYYFYSMFFQLALEDLQRQRIPVSLSSVLKKAPEVAGLFDRAFPGYIEADCVKIILEQIA